MKRAQAKLRICSRNGLATSGSVRLNTAPLRSLMALTSSALPLPCSDSLAPAMRLRLRHSYESRSVTAASGAPSSAAAGPTSSRTHCATASAMLHSSTGGGLIATCVWSGIGHALEPHQVNGRALRRLGLDRQRREARNLGEALVAGERRRRRQQGGRRHPVQFALQLTLQFGIGGLRCAGDADDHRHRQQHPERSLERLPCDID